MSLPVIYKVESPSNKIYIGQTWDFDKRIYKYKVLNCQKQKKLFASLMKYGFDNHTFKVIHELPIDIIQTVLDKYEDFYIQQYKECNFNMMNLKGGGATGKHSEESKKLMSTFQLSRVRTYVRPKGVYFHTPETKLKIGEAGMARVTKESTRKKLSASLVGNTRTKGKTGKRGRHIIQCDKNGNIIREWISIKLAAQEVGRRPTAINNCLSKRVDMCAGFKWIYKNK